MRNKLAVGALTLTVGFLLATNPVVVNAAGQITGSQIKKNTVTSKQIKNNTIKGGDVKDDSLTGADVLESSLATVPSATSATTAGNATTVGGLAPNQLVRAQSVGTSINSSGNGTTNIGSFTAPVQGQAQVAITVSCASFSGTTNTRYDLTPRVDGSAIGSLGVLFLPHAAIADPGDSVTLLGQASVAPGTHTVSVQRELDSGNGSMDCNARANILFVPFKNDGSQRSVAPDAATGRGASR